MTSFAGRVALVTGANRGLGLETARQLVALGATVLTGARSAERAAAAAHAVGHGARPIALDVTSPEDVAACARVITRELEGRLDILVNNAAVHYDTRQTPSMADLAVVQEAWATNVLGAWRMAQMVLPFMRRRRWGRVVNVSSQAGAWHSLDASAPAYRTSKVALNALTVMLADELRGSGVLVNAVCPGWVATDMGGRGGRPIPDGARSIIWAACLPDDGPSGGFFRDGRPLDW